MSLRSSCVLLTDNLDNLWLFLMNNTLISFSEAFFTLWLVSEAGRMLICVFHCCNKSRPHKFMAVLATCGFNLPICPPGPVHSTHLVLGFTSDEVPIPRSWIFTSWRGQSECRNFGKIIVTSAPVSKPSISMLLLCWALLHLLHNPKGWGLLFRLSLGKTLLDSRNTLSTIPFQMTLLSTIKTSAILIFL